MKLDLESLIEMIGEISTEDPIDWGMLNIDEDDATRLIALNVLEMQNDWQSLDPIQKEYMVTSTIAKLVLENFVLNLKLLQAK